MPAVVEGYVHEVGNAEVIHLLPGYRHESGNAGVKVPRSLESNTRRSTSRIHDGLAKDSADVPAA